MPIYVQMSLLLLLMGGFDGESSSIYLVSFDSVWYVNNAVLDRAETDLSLWNTFYTYRFPCWPGLPEPNLRLKEKTGCEACFNIRYPSERHLKLTSHENSCDHNVLLSCPIPKNFVQIWIWDEFRRDNLICHSAQVEKMSHFDAIDNIL